MIKNIDTEGKKEGNRKKDKKDREKALQKKKWMVV